MHPHFSFFLSIAVCYSQQIKLREPLDSTIFAIRKGDDKTSVAIRYDIPNFNNFSNSNLQLCMQLDEIITVKTLLPLTCFQATEESETKSLSDLPIGSFLLTMIFRDSSPSQMFYDESRISSSFSVRRIEELLPKIFIPNTIVKSVDEEDKQTHEQSEIIMVASPMEGKFTDVGLTYSLGKSLLRMEEFDMCLRINEMNTNTVILQSTCLATTRRDLTFQEMKLGSYTLSLVLSERSNSNEQDNDNKIFGSTEVSALIHIKSLTDYDMMPSIILTKELPTIDLLTSDGKADIIIDFSLIGLPSAMALVEVCALRDELDGLSLTNDVSSIAVICASEGQSFITLEGVEKGMHRIKLFLRLAEEPYTIFWETQQITTIELRAPEPKVLNNWFVMFQSSISSKIRGICGTNIERILFYFSLLSSSMMKLLNAARESISTTPTLSKVAASFQHVKDNILLSFPNQPSMLNPLLQKKIYDGFDSMKYSNIFFEKITSGIASMIPQMPSFSAVRLPIPSLPRFPTFDLPSFPSFSTRSLPIGLFEKIEESNFIVVLEKGRKVIESNSFFIFRYCSKLVGSLLLMIFRLFIEISNLLEDLIQYFGRKFSEMLLVLGLRSVNSYSSPWVLFNTGIQMGTVFFIVSILYFNIRNKEFYISLVLHIVNPLRGGICHDRKTIS